MRRWAACGARHGLPARLGKPSECADHPEKYAHITAPVPYDMRHSFGTEVYRSTGDLKVTKEMMGHSTMRMTERYTLAAVPERQRHAVRAAFRHRK